MDIRRRVLWLFLLVSGTAWAQQYLITTVAGSGIPAAGVPAVSQPIYGSYGVAVDAIGDVYLTSDNTVFKVDAEGILTRVAGSQTGGYSGDGGPATRARLSGPSALAFDTAGNLYIGDGGNNVIRIVAPDGVITTAAVSVEGAKGLASDGLGNLYIATVHGGLLKRTPSGAVSLVANLAYLSDVAALAADASGNLYVADNSGRVVRKVSLDGVVTVVAGNGEPGNSGDGGPATSAELLDPWGVAVDAGGNLYIATSGAIRKVAPDGTMTTVLALGYNFGYYGGFASDAAGNLYLSANYQNRVYKVSPDRTLTVIAGNGQALYNYSGEGGPATAAQLAGPSGVAAGGAGEFYIADTYNNAIRRVTASGTITTLAGTGALAWRGGYGGPAIDAELARPDAVAVDGAGSVYIADYYSWVIGKVDPSGTLSGIADIALPTGVAVDATGNVYALAWWQTGDWSHGSQGQTWSEVLKVTPDGTVTTAAGGPPGFSGDGGPATSAQLSASQQGVAVDAAGNLYIGDSGNGRVRKVAADGTITTVAGNGSPGCSGDNGPASSAAIGTPTGVAVDAAGNLFIATADFYASVIRKVAANGIITTIAGDCAGGGAGYAGDGGPATSAVLGSPHELALDSAGDLYVADADNNVIRLLVPMGTRALLSANITHATTFAQGQMGASYSITITNAAGAGPTSGIVTVSEMLPAVLTLVSMAGTGWSCSGNTCSRSDPLGPGFSYPPITLAVNIAVDATKLVTSQVSVSGGGSAATGASDLSIILALPTTPTLSSPANGANGIVLAPVLAWGASSGATSYDVYFGSSPVPPLVTNIVGTTYAPGAMSTGVTYYWQIVARNSAGAAGSATWSFTTTSTAATGLHFVPVAPCRLADTRYTSIIAGGTSRDFAVPQLGGCGIPSTAQAYSLNITAVPAGYLGYLTIWPTGQPQPNASTLNSWQGIVVANATVVPAGTNGAVSVHMSNDSNVILDINGYFDTSSGPTSYAFYSATPCRVVDTRFGTGQFGGPELDGANSRDFPIPLSSCPIPATARGYSLNFTAVPPGYLGFLTTWPTGQPRPNASTLNSWSGKVVANAAIVPAGTNESVSVYGSNATQLIMDINGYFGQPGSAGALSFYPVAPCRVADTRYGTGTFGGPEMERPTTRVFPIPASACNIPTTAAAYSLNVTVVPDGLLSYLTIWPAGSAQPNVSTLNSFDGSVVANAAIVPAGNSGAIDVYVTNPTHVILDINGYFAP